MAGLESYHLQTGFFPGSRGSIHLTVFLPLTATPSRWVIHFPAFAEEMNKSRAMVARTARGLAELGVAVVVPDLFGTGDSDGDFVEAEWETWIADQLSLAGWAREQGASELVFWGLRAGCLLAAEAASKMVSPPKQLIFWQPVPSGKQQMTQFLRLRMAATLQQRADGRNEQVNVVELREELLAEKSLRVAGYQLGAGLFQAIESRQLSDFTIPASTQVSVWEIKASAAIPGSRVIQKQLEQWQQKGLQCAFFQVQGDPFWATQELGLAQALTDETVAAIGFENFLPGSAGPKLAGLNNSSSQYASSLPFHCGGSRLIGVVHIAPGNACEIGVVIVVGGPQYRIGSHRQFVLLARALASEGHAVLRFDYRGMGDSEGAHRGFENIDEDIRSAIDALQVVAPSVKRVALWGLCDAATASACYAASDQRVSGLVLVNPWVFSEKGSAKAYLKHYYVKRLLSRHFWSKLLSGHFRPAQSLVAFVRFAKVALLKSGDTRQTPDLDKAVELPPLTKDRLSEQSHLPKQFAQGLTRFPGSVLLIISGNDLTAAEFVDAGRSCNPLHQALTSPQVNQVDLPGVDHTFSRPNWRQKVEQYSIEFLRSL